jgi:hypothetical protein
MELTLQPGAGPKAAPPLVPGGANRKKEKKEKKNQRK